LHNEIKKIIGSKKSKPIIMGYFCINFYSGFFIIIMPTNKQIVIFLNIKNKKE
jgi:hypothetical protein